jgi:hypothetical protein
VEPAAARDAVSGSLLRPAVSPRILPSACGESKALVRGLPGAGRGDHLHHFSSGTPQCPVWLSTRAMQEQTMHAA